MPMAPTVMRSLAAGDSVDLAFSWSLTVPPDGAPRGGRGRRPPDPADGVVFSDPGIQSPTVTVDNAAGDVTLTLSVTDAFNPSVLGELTVTVYEDACQAARIGDGQAANYPLDVVPDCVINLLDLAEMAVIWLEDYSLTEAVPVE